MAKILKAVFFDMDGVLVDTMKYHVAAWVGAFNHYGYYPDELPFYLNEGVKHPKTVRDRLGELGIDDVSDELIEKIYTLKRKIYDQTVVIKPTDGVIELLESLRGRVTIGLVTGGIPSVVTRVLQLFDDYFDLVVDYDSTTRGKPEADPYILATQKAEVTKDTILAIENSPTGIASAVDAGLTCWAICTTLQPEYLARAHEIFSDFDALKQRLYSAKEFIIS